MKIRKKLPEKNAELSGAMTDISFLLIIFFLVTAVFVVDEGLLSQLPNKDTRPLQKSENNVVQVHIKSETEFMVNTTTTVSSVQALESVISTLLDDIAGNPNAISDKVLILSADDKVEYELVVNAINSARKAGINYFTVFSEEGEVGVQDEFLIPLQINDTTSTRASGELP